MVKVPGFLLKKLYVKKSLKNVDDGFQFELNNVLANATIVEPITLIVDKEEIPVDNVEIVIGDKNLKAGDISADNPIAFNVKTRITIVVKGKKLESGKHNIEIRTKAKEYGELKFSFSDNVE